MTAIHPQLEELIDAAEKWCTDDRSPATIDLLVLDGLRLGKLVDEHEARGIIREIANRTADGNAHDPGWYSELCEFLAETGLDKWEP